MQYARLLWLAPLALLWGGAFSPVGADSGQLKGLSVTAAPGAGPLDIDFTINETTLTVTSTSGTPVPPGTDTTFGGTIDFGDLSGPPAPPLLSVVSQKQERRVGDQYGFSVSLQGVISHTYPAAGPFTATFQHCCLGRFKVAYGSLYFTTDSPGDVNISIPLTVGTPPSLCEEETLFKQLDCQLDKLIEALDQLGLEADRPTFNALLHNQLNTAKNKRKEAKDKCDLPDEARATTAMSVARTKVHAFKQTVDGSPYIDDGAEGGLVSQATPIEDTMQGLIDAGVCSGDVCLPDPPLGALHCEVGKLLDLVAAQVADAKLAKFLTDKLNRINDFRDDIIGFCDDGKPQRTVGKLKSSLGQLKAIGAKLNIVEKKGTLPADVIAALRQGVDQVKAILDNLLLTGACS